MAKMKINHKHYSAGAVIWIVILLRGTFTHRILRHHGVQDRCRVPEHQCNDPAGKLAELPELY